MMCNFDFKGVDSRLAKPEKPECTIVLEDFDGERNAEDTL